MSDAPSVDGSVDGSIPAEAIPAPPPLPPLPYASWGSRVAAFLADSFIEGMLQMPLAAVLGALAAGLVRATGAMGDVFWDASGHALTVLWLTLGAFNRIVVQWYFGGTAGKMLFGIRVANLDGGEVSFLTLVKRYFCYFLSVLPLGLGLLAPLWNSRRQAFHDSLAGTLVLEKGPATHGKC